MSIFSTRILNRNDLDIYEDGEESRDFVYIDDVVDATILGIEKEEGNGQIFNVGSGFATSVKDVAEYLKNYFNSDVNILISGKYRLGDIRHNYADLTKINDISTSIILKDLYMQLLPHVMVFLRIILQMKKQK